MEAGIDVDIARWILEFLVRQPLKNCTLNTLVEILPLTDDNVSIKKSLLLRRLDSETAAGIPSEDMLDLLELIEEVDCRCRTSGHSGPLQTAYCHVAVACTVKWLGHEVEYLRAVKRIWKARVSKMVEAKGASVGLVSEELRVWAADIEKAVLDDGWIAELREKSGGIDAVAVVRRYVKEEKKIMGPSFLEVVAEALRTDDSLRKKLGLLPRGSFPAAATVSANGVTQQGTKRKYAVSNRTTRGARIAVADVSGTQKYNLVSSPEVDAVQKALNLSSAELKSVVKDPLPDAIDLSRNVVSGAASKDATEVPVEQADGGDVGTRTEDAPGQSKDSTEMPVEQKHDENGAPVEGSRPAPCNGADTAKDSSKRQRDAPGPSLVERNSTAHTMEWEDDLSGGKRVRLSSPATRPVSPLNVRGDKSKDHVPTRRKAKRWSLLEEDTLRTCVETFGRGNWKVILQSNRDVFEDRTENGDSSLESEGDDSRRFHGQGAMTYKGVNTVLRQTGYIDDEKDAPDPLNLQGVKARPVFSVDKSEIKLHMTFCSKTELREAVSRCSLKVHNREYYVTESKIKSWTAVCKSRHPKRQSSNTRGPACEWRVHAALKYNNTVWEVTKLVETHVCGGLGE